MKKTPMAYSRCVIGVLLFLSLSLVFTSSLLASGLSFDARQKQPLTTKGDLDTFSTTIDRLPVGTDGQVLSADSSTSTGLKWVTLPASAGSGTVTNSGTLTSNAVIIGGGTTVVSAITADSSTSHVLFSTGTSPAFRNFNTPDVAAGTFGSNVGGTGQTSYSLGDLLMGTSTGLKKVAVGSMGQLLSADTTAGVKWVTGIVTKDVATTGIFGSNMGGTGQSSYTKGDILVGTTTGLLKVGVGSMGQILSVDTGATSGVKWVASPSTVAGSSTEFQYRNAGAFGATSVMTWDATNLRVGIGNGVGPVSFDVAGSIRSVPVSTTTNGTINLDASRSNSFIVILNGNPNTLSSITNGTLMQKIVVLVSQDATGSRKMGFGTNIKFGTDITSFDATTQAGANDYIGLIFNGVSWDVAAVARSYS